MDSSKKGGLVVDNPTGSDQPSKSTHIRPQQVDLPIQERFQHLDVFKKPLCLVSNDSNMSLQIVEDVLQQISHIDVPVSVVGVCGIYRSGKSYLMNKLYGKTKGFALGNTIQPKTKGIWVWCKPHPTSPGHVLILLDTEGLGDVAKRDEHHDTKIFCLTMLMSSVLIYNVKGIIDQDALKKLSFITQVTKTVSVSGSTDDEDEKASLRYVSPNFVLCLRDFSLDLEDEGELTPDEYLEKSLRESPSEKDEEYNSVRRCINTFFPRRKCFVMATPASSKSLKKLETLPEEELDEDFREGMQKMITFVHDSGTKCLDNVSRKEYNGQIFVMFMRIYIRAISEGKKMEYISAMEAVSMNQNEKLCDDVWQQYREELDKLQLMSQPSKKKLTEELWGRIVTLLRHFRQDAYPFRVVWYEDKCMDKMKCMMTDVLKKHSCEVQRLCHEYLDTERKTMVEHNTERYKDVQEYKKDFDNLIKKYHKKFENYDEEERNVVILAVMEESHVEVLEMEHQAEIRKKIDENKKMQAEKHDQKIRELKEEQSRNLQTELQNYQQRIQQMEDENIKTMEKLEKKFAALEKEKDKTVKMQAEKHDRQMREFREEQNRYAQIERQNYNQRMQEMEDANERRIQQMTAEMRDVNEIRIQQIAAEMQDVNEIRIQQMAAEMRALRKEKDSQRTKLAKENDVNEIRIQQMAAEMRALRKEKDSQRTKLAKENDKNVKMQAEKHEQQMREFREEQNRNAQIERQNYKQRMQEMKDANESRIQQMEEKMKEMNRRNGSCNVS